MGDSRRIYLKQVAKRLCCPPEERTRLLAGLENEMAECCPGGAGLSAAVLASRFGAPEDVAAELQRAVPAESVLRYGRRKQLFFMFALAVCVAAVACLALCLFWVIGQLGGRIIVSTDILYRS